MSPPFFQTKKIQTSHSTEIDRTPLRARNPPGMLGASPAALAGSEGGRQAGIGGEAGTEGGDTHKQGLGRGKQAGMGERQGWRRGGGGGECR